MNYYEKSPKENDLKNDGHLIVAMDSGEKSNSPEMPDSEVEEVNELAALVVTRSIDYGTAELPKPATTSSPNGKGAKKKKKAKELSDLLKIDMASERTFFKWLRTGMQIGAIGTFVFVALDHKQGSPWGIATVAFAWLVGFALVLYGLWSYYGRRAAMRSGDISHVPEFMREHAPLMVVISLVAVVVAGLAYAAVMGDGVTNKFKPIPYPTTPPSPVIGNSLSVTTSSR